MSRGDDNLDKLFQDAFSGQKHEMSPAYWHEAQQLLQANKVAPAPFYAKPLLLVSTAITVTISAFLFSDSTPETNAVLAANPISLSKESIQLEPTSVSENSIIETSENATSTKPTSTLAIISETTNVSHKDVEVDKTNSRTIELKRDHSNSGSSATLIVSNSQSNVEPISQKKNSIAVNSEVTNTEIANTEFSIANNSQVFKYSEANENWNYLNLEYIDTRTLSGLTTNDGSNSNPDFSTGNHKKLGSPYNLRVSIGSMWSSYQDHNSSISNTYQDNNVALSIEYQLKNRFGIQAGISFTQSNVSQTYSYTDEKDLSYWNEEHVITKNTNKVWWLGGWYYYDPSFDTTLNRTYISQFDTLNNQLKVSHKIQLIEIPLLMTYNYGIERFNIQLSTGLSFSKPIGGTGSLMLSEDPFPGNVSVSEHLNSIQTSFLFRTELAYGLDDKWWITGRPQMKINMNNLYKSPTTIDSKLWFYGINLGLMYKF